MFAAGQEMPKSVIFEICHPLHLFAVEISSTSPCKTNCHSAIMSSQGPYGRQGYSANPQGYGGAGAYGAAPPQGGASYSTPSYGYGGGGGQSASYSTPAPQAGTYGVGGGADSLGYGQTGGMDYQVCSRLSFHPRHGRIG